MARPPCSNFKFLGVRIFRIFTVTTSCTHTANVNQLLFWAGVQLGLQNDMCVQRLGSTCASIQSDQSLLWWREEASHYWLSIKHTVPETAMLRLYTEFVKRHNVMGLSVCGFVKVLIFWKYAISYIVYLCTSKRIIDIIKSNLCIYILLLLLLFFFFFFWGGSQIQLVCVCVGGGGHKFDFFYIKIEFWYWKSNFDVKNVLI